MKSPVYLDYNATTPIDPKVAEAMWPFISTRFENPSSSYQCGQTVKEAINKARQQVAQLINASPEEIVFTSGGTESNNHATRGVIDHPKNKGKHIITSSIEHPAITEVCKYLESQGNDITYIPVDSTGKVNPEDVKKAVRPDTMLITIMHANNEVGTIQPIREIAKVAKQNHVPVHTDAAQSAGKITTDVKDLGLDLLSLAGHKLYAPKGIGALYIKKGTRIANLLYGAGQEKGMRPGTENVPYIVALGKAAEIAHWNLKTNAANMSATRDRLINGLKKQVATNVIVNGDLPNALPNTLSVAFEGIDAHTLTSLVGNKLCLSTGSACHADSVELSPVLKAMNIDHLKGAGTVRLSTGRSTTNEEIDYAIEVLSEKVKNLI
ncbi:MAG: cysteine desulfurase family protein [Bacteroidota bacterium]